MEDCFLGVDLWPQICLHCDDLSRVMLAGVCVFFASRCACPANGWIRSVSDVEACPVRWLRCASTSEARKPTTKCNEEGEPLAQRPRGTSRKLRTKKRTVVRAIEKRYLNLVKFCIDSGYLIPPKFNAQLARLGSVEIMEYAESQNFCFNEEVFAEAVNSGALDLVQWLHARHCPYNEDAAVCAAALGSLNVFRFLLSQNCPLNNRIYEGVCLRKWSLENVKERLETLRRLTNSTTADPICNVGLEECSKNLEICSGPEPFMLSRLLAVGDPSLILNSEVYPDLVQNSPKQRTRLGTDLVKSNCIAAAAAANNLPLLNYLLEQGCTLSYNALHNAVKVGNLEMMKRCVEHGEFPDRGKRSPIAEAVKQAAKSSNFALLKYLLAAGYPILSKAIKNAVCSGNLELLKLLEEFGADFSQSFVVPEFHDRFLECTKYLYTHGKSITRASHDQALACGAVQTAEFFKSKGVTVNVKNLLVHALRRDNLQVLEEYGDEVWNDLPIKMARSKEAFEWVLHKTGNLDPYFLNRALDWDDPETVQWLLENGCAVRPRCIFTALANCNYTFVENYCLPLLEEANSSVLLTALAITGDLKRLFWLHDLKPNLFSVGETVTDNLSNFLVKKGRLEMLKYFVKNGYPIGEGVAQYAWDCGRYRIWEYLREQARGHEL